MKVQFKCDWPGLKGEFDPQLRGDICDVPHGVATRMQALNLVTFDIGSVVIEIEPKSIEDDKEHKMMVSTEQETKITKVADKPANPKRRKYKKRKRKAAKPKIKPSDEPQEAAPVVPVAEEPQAESGEAVAEALSERTE